MDDLSVDVDALRARSATFRSVGEEQISSASLRESGVESDIAAFGEINAALHEQWRSVRAAQRQAWQSLGLRHDEHGSKVMSNANGYDGQESANTSALRLD